MFSKADDFAFALTLRFAFQGSDLLFTHSGGCYIKG
jgi:hypothetical protein